MTIPNVVVSAPSQLFTLPDSFTAIAGGSIYIGKIDTDPTVAANQIQVYVQNNDGKTAAVTQPISIGAGGYPEYNGAVAKFVTVEGQSMAVLDANGVQQFYYPDVLKYDPDQFKDILATKDGASLVGFGLDISYGDTINLFNFLSNVLILDNFYFSADNGNYGPAITRASAYCSNNSIALFIPRFYSVNTGAVLSSNTSIFGTGKNSGFYCPPDLPVTILTATNQSNIFLKNIYINGGVTRASTSLPSTRGVRFITSTDIIMDGCWSGYCADWAISVEKCDRVQYLNHNHEGGGLGDPGGRDGFHALDCNYVTVRNAHIDSGDDCIGITVQTRACTNIDIDGVVGRSDVASVVTIADENNSSGASISAVSINNVKAINSADCRYIVQLNMPNGSSMDSITLSNITGFSSLYGIFAAGVNSLGLYTITVKSINQHGIYATRCAPMTFDNINGTSGAGNFDGINFASCSEINGGTLIANSGPHYGLQLNACSDVIVRNAILTNNAVANLRLSNCTGILDIGGNLSAEPSATAHGVSNSGSPTLRIRPGTTVGGAVPYNARPQWGTFDEPYAVACFSQNALSTVTIIFSENIASITASGIGSITITFNDTLRNVNYDCQVNSLASGTTIPYPVVRSKTTSSVSFNVYDLAAGNALTYGTFTVKIYESLS